jgi:hypothetical protein
MASVSEERYVFETEWFDQQADLIRKYLFTFYPKDGTIDMVSLPPIPYILIICPPLKPV